MLVAQFLLHQATLMPVHSQPVHHMIPRNVPGEITECSLAASKSHMSFLLNSKVRCWNEWGRRLQGRYLTLSRT